MLKRTGDVEKIGNGALIAIWQYVDGSNASGSGQTVDVPVQFFVRSDMTTYARGYSTRPVCAACVEVPPSLEHVPVPGNAEAKRALQPDDQQIGAGTAVVMRVPNFETVLRVDASLLQTFSDAVGRFVHRSFSLRIVVQAITLASAYDAPAGEWTTGLCHHCALGFWFVGLVRVDHYPVLRFAEFVRPLRV